MKKRISLVFFLSIILIISIFSFQLPVPVAATELRNQLTRAQADNITPTTSAFDNYERIQWCLDQYNVAKLGVGEFLISNPLMMNDGDLLTSNNLQWPSIKLNAPADAVVKILGSNCQITFLTLNYNNQYISGNYPCKAVIQIFGSNNQVNNCHVKGGNAPQDYNVMSENSLKTMTGIYFVETASRGNLCENNQIYYNTYGVIFRSGITNTGTSNKIKNSQLYYNKSDAITLAGYGEIDGNSIHHNGYDCMNGFIGTPPVPIPGGGIYAIYNNAGSLIKNNTIYDNCGHGIDIAKSRYFVIQNNYSYDPGCRTYPSCSTTYQNITYGNGISMAIADSANFTITDNICVNNRATNRVGNAVYTDPATNHFFSATGAADYSDLPSGANQVIAFSLTETANQTYHTVGNTIRNNDFRAYVTSPSVGLGYFASRGTGFGQVGILSDLYWGADSTNYYTLNDPNGSSIGSRRCGGNWYAANGTDPNTDDSQHVAPNSDWAGNDLRQHY